MTEGRILMKTTFYTGRGDGGKSLYGNKRLSKSSLLFDALGDLDELNTWIGVCRSAIKPKEDFKIKKLTLDEILVFVEESLFMLQAEVAAVGFGYSAKDFKKIDGEKTAFMESVIVEIDVKIPPIHNFIIPGGSPLGAKLDFARVLARRMERTVVKFSEREKVSPESLKFLNRLSSLFFALARHVNHEAGVKETNPKYA